MTDAGEWDLEAELHKHQAREAEAAAILRAQQALA